MTAKQLIDLLSRFPGDAIVMSNSGWECSETHIGRAWYSDELNEIHLTQGGDYEKREGYTVDRKVGDEWKDFVFKEVIND